jgi:dTDP-glucose 4,6-dehydratase
MSHMLITGGGGSIGVHVVAHVMHNTDWCVTVLDSFRHKGCRDRIREACSVHPEWKARIRIIQHDLCCAISEPLAADIGPVDYIVHLAAMSDVGFSVENPVYVIRNNVESTLTMLEYASQREHKAFVYFSTDEVYGPVEPGTGHKEWSPHRPSNAYAASKAAGEDICYPYWRSGSVNLVITNTMNNFGEMQSPSKFPVIVQKAVTEGTELTLHTSPSGYGSRFYIHSRNTADALLWILQKPPHGHTMGQIDDPDRYHIVGDEALTNREMAEMITELMGGSVNAVDVDIHSSAPAHDLHYGLEDNYLSAQGWTPPVSLRESMARTIEWQQEHPEWMR